MEGNREGEGRAFQAEVQAMAQGKKEHKPAAEDLEFKVGVGRCGPVRLERQTGARL